MKKIFFLMFFFLNLTGFCFAEVRVVGGLTQEQTVIPGEKYEKIILLSNLEKDSCEVKVYQTDYLFFSNGENIYADPGNMPRSNAKWLSLSSNLITIPPQDTASIYYTINIPKDPALNGTYWSMVMIEPTAETGLESRQWDQKKVTMDIQTIMRYGVQVVTDIADTGVRKIKFLDKKLIRRDGKKILQIDIENIGDRRLSPFVWVELYNPEAVSIGRFESSRWRIYPYCSVRHGIDLTQVPAGNYKALVVVDNGDEYVFGAQYDLGIK